MPIYFSIHPIVQNPPLARKQDISFLQYTYNTPEVFEDGLNLVDSFDFPFVNPGESSASHSLGGPFSNMIVQATFINRKGKNRGRIILALGLSFIGTEEIIQCIPDGPETTISIFIDDSIDRIRVENQTEDGYAVHLDYGQGGMVVQPSFSVAVNGGSLATDFVNALIDNNNLPSNHPYVQDPEKAFVRRIAGPNKF